MGRIMERIAKFMILLSAIMLSALSIVSLVGGWFFWGWGLFANMLMSLFDAMAFAFAVIIFWLLQEGDE